MLRRKGRECQAAPTRIGPPILPHGLWENADISSALKFRRTVLGGSTLVLPSWDIGTVAAMRAKTLKSPSAGEPLPLFRAKLWRKWKGSTVDGYAQGRSVPYLTLSLYGIECPPFVFPLSEALSMSRKLGAVALALGILVGAMGLKTMIAAHSTGAVVMANGLSPAPPIGGQPPK